MKKVSCFICNNPCAVFSNTFWTAFGLTQNECQWRRRDDGVMNTYGRAFGKYEMMECGSEQRVDLVHDSSGPRLYCPTSSRCCVIANALFCAFMFHFIGFHSIIMSFELARFQSASHSQTLVVFPFSAVFHCETFEHEICELFALFKR